MLKTRFVRKTFYLSVQDEQAIAAIMDKYGCSTQSDAVRLALRILATSQVSVKKRKT